MHSKMLLIVPAKHYVNENGAVADSFYYDLPLWPLHNTQIVSAFMIPNLVDSFHTLKQLFQLR